MSKLIRLTTDGSNGFFKNSFNEDIIIKPMSKVALLNTAMSFSDKTIPIDDDNDEIAFEIANKGRITATLSKGAYEPKPFLEMLSNSMNEALVYDGAMIGSMWKAVINSDNKLALQLNRSKMQIPDIPTKNIVGVTKGSGTTETWQSNVARGFQAFIFSNDIFIESCGVLQVDVNTKGDCYFGLTTDSLAGTSTISLDTFKYAIGISDDGAGALNYVWVIDGAEIDSGILADNGRTLQLRLHSGFIHFVVMDGTTIEYTLTSTPYAKTDYNCLLSLYDPSTILQKLRWTNNPYIQSTTNGYTYFELDTSIDESNKYLEYTTPLETYNAGPPKKLAKINLLLEFPKENLRKLLGYSDPSYQVLLVKHTFTAESNFDIATAPSSVIIELPYIPIDSFDGKATQRRRRNILAIIPNFIESNEKLIYEPSNLTWVSMNNKASLSLREFAVKVTSWNDDIVQFSSGCTISLVIEG